MLNNESTTSLTVDLLCDKPIYFKVETSKGLQIELFFSPARLTSLGLMQLTSVGHTRKHKKAYKSVNGFMMKSKNFFQHGNGTVV